MSSINRKRKKVQEQNQDTWKDLLVLVLVEIMAYAYVCWKGYGMAYVPVTIVLILVTVIIYITALRMRMEINLINVIVLLINVGFAIQTVSGSEIRYVVFFAAVGVACLVGMLYRILAPQLMTQDMTAVILAAIQIGLVVAVWALGKMTQGTDAGAQAKLSLSIGGMDIQVFEFCKILYLAMLVIVLCRKDTYDKKILRMPREIFLIGVTVIFTFILIANNDLGAILLIWTTCLIMMFIYSHYRARSILLLTGFIGAFAGLWALCSMGYTYIAQSIPDFEMNPLGKVVKRFAFALHPEQDMANAGYQGTRALMGVALGGLTGQNSKSHILSIPEAVSDMIYANIIQHLGMVTGICIIIGFVSVLRIGAGIAEETEKDYNKGMAMAISILLSVECFIHIAYNLGAMPITGITLYFVSSGFSSLSAGLMMIAILLVISSKRKPKTEKRQKRRRRRR